MTCIIAPYTDDLEQATRYLAIMEWADNVFAAIKQGVSNFAHALLKEIGEEE